MKNINDYSDPLLVQELANKYLGDVTIYLSSRKDKKYMVRNPAGNIVHFGQYPYQDFTKHGDINRRDSFRKRNVKWKDAPKWSAAWLAYHLLW